MKDAFTLFLPQAFNTVSFVVAHKSLKVVGNVQNYVNVPGVILHLKMKKKCTHS
jgi:hypothetical protein